MPTKPQSTNENEKSPLSHAAQHAEPTLPITHRTNPTHPDSNPNEKTIQRLISKSS